MLCTNNSRTISWKSSKTILVTAAMPYDPRVMGSFAVGMDQQQHVAAAAMLSHGMSFNGNYKVKNFKKIIINFWLIFDNNICN